MNNLTVGIGADISNLQAGIASAQSSISGFVSSANSRLQSFGDSISGIGQKLSIGLSIPLGLLGKQALENGAGLESLKMGLKSIEEQQYGAGKSAEYAASRFAEFIEIAKLPGVGLKEAISMSIGLRSVGFSADEAKREILAFGNTLALVGKGKNELNGVALQLQQLSGKSSGFGADLRIIKEYAPQVGAALLQAFGTLDTEAIAKTGVTGKQVIEKITTELEKLPKAGAGLKTAMENVSDSVFIATGRIGEALNKSLGLTSVFDSIGNAVGTLADYFTGLSPEIQKFIGITAGVLVIVPPLLISIGALVPVFGLLTTGIAAILSPIGLVVAGLAGLAYVVATNWNEVKGFLSDTGIWDGISLIVQNTFGVIKGIFTTTVSIIKSIWNTGLSIIQSDTFGIFGVISGIVSAALQVIGGVVGVFSNLLQGNWSGLFVSLKNVMKGAFNAMISITEGFTVAIVGSFQKIFEVFGADKIVSQFKQATDSIKKQFEGFKYKVELDKTENTTTNKKETSKIEGGLLSVPPKPKSLTDEEKNAQNKAVKDTEDLLIKLAQFKADILDDEVQKAIDTETVKADKEAEAISRSKARSEVKAQAMIALERSHMKTVLDIKAEAQKKESEFIINSFSNQIVKERALEQLSFEDKLKNVPKIIQGKANQHKAIELLEIEHQAKMREIEGKGGIREITPSSIKLGGIGSKLIDGLDGFGKVGTLTNPIEQISNNIKNSIPKLQSTLAEVTGVFMTANQRMRLQWAQLGTMGRPSVKLLSAMLKDSLPTISETFLSMAKTIDNGAKSMLGGFGKVIGAMSVGKAGISDVGNMLLEGFGGILVSLGEQMIASSSLLASAASAIALALTPAGAGLALAAGIGLVALGSALSSSASSGGGGTSGGGASSYAQNYSSGSGSFGGGSQFNGGGGQILTLNLNMSGETRLQGNDLVTSIKRTEKQQVRIRG